MKYIQVDPDYVFIGNTDKNTEPSPLLSQIDYITGKALDIDGNELPEHLAVFVHKKHLEIYSQAYCNKMKEEQSK